MLRLAEDIVFLAETELKEIQRVVDKLQISDFNLKFNKNETKVMTRDRKENNNLKNVCM